MDQGRILSVEVDQFLTDAIHSGKLPGAVLLVSSRGQVVHERAYGDAQRVPSARPMSVDTLFDVASLTKVLATSLAFMALAEARSLSIDQAVSSVLATYEGNGREKITLADLLTHGSGLPAWRPFYREIVDGEPRGGPRVGSPQARRVVLDAAQRTQPDRPRGESAVYSDVGFLILTDVIEKVSGKRLDHFCEERLYRALDLRNTFYLPNGEGAPRAGRPRESFAATDSCPWRGRVLVGEVSDDNTFAMGGVGGHAGLFSTAGDIHRIAAALLDIYYGGKRGVLSPETLREFWRRRVFRDSTLRAYGWDVPSPGGSQAGKLFSGETFGHLGFTGTSLWIDAARQIVVVLLTNRVHPSRTNDKIREVRPALHDLVMEHVLRRPEHATSVAVPGDVGGEGWGDAEPTVVPGMGADKVGAPTRWHILPTERKPGLTSLKALTRQPLEKVWLQCKGCSATMYRKELDERFGVCPRCGFHHTLGVDARIRLLADAGSWVEMDAGVTPTDPLSFVEDGRSYKSRLAAAHKKLGTRDALRAGRCTIDGVPTHMGIFDFSFMGGSMGSVVGEKITRVFERALEHKTAAVIVSASGGARMQEGVLSLMQMSKTCAALSRLQAARLPYISVLCHPTTGGVAASFSMLGDVNIAEPGALVGFAGPRVIEQTIRQKLPEGFQRSEFLLEHGMIDIIAERKELKGTIGRIFHMLMD